VIDGSDICINMGNLGYLKLAKNIMYSEISLKTDVNNFWPQAYNSTGCFLGHYDNEIVLDNDTNSGIDSDTETNVSFPS
jgi:hypothetical protein